MGARIRLLLPCVAVCLAASGAAAIGAVCVRAVGGYVIRQGDDGLRACASSMLSHGPVAVAGSGAVPGQAPPVPCDMELLSVSGHVLIPAPAGVGGPAIPASGSWLAAHLAGSVTVPDSGNSGRWRVVIKAVHYQAQRMLFVFGPDDLRYLISGPTGHGSAGMLVVMAGLAGAGQPAAGYAAAAGTVLVLLTAAAFAVTRAILRPLREAARLTADARHGGGGRPGDVMASPGVLADRYGMAAARMRQRLQASHAAEAAARRSAADMAGHLEQACLQLRRQAAIVHGFTEYCHKHGRPPPAALDQMMQRVTGEITRMETLVDGLRMRSAGQSTGPDRRPDPPATDPAAHARLPDTRRARGCCSCVSFTWQTDRYPPGERSSHRRLASTLRRGATTRGDLMKAIVQERFGPPEVLQLVDTDPPEAGAGEVLVRVHAAALNPYDWHIMRGDPLIARLVGEVGLTKPKARVAGIDAAGVVEVVGANVHGLRHGDEVLGFCRGAFAQYARAEADMVVPKPVSLTFEQAAAVPMAGATALRGIRDVGAVRAGQRVLVNGAAGGVGTYAVQIAAALGAEVTGVCSTRNAGLVRSIGAAHVVDYTTQDFTDGRVRYDVILDNVGNRPVSRLRRALTPAGTLVLNGGGSPGHVFGPVAGILRAVVVNGLVRERLRLIPHEQKREQLLTLTGLIEAGKLTPVLDRTYPLAGTAEGLRRVEQGHARGKVVITVA